MGRFDERRAAVGVVAEVEAVEFRDGVPPPNDGALAVVWFLRVDDLDGFSYWAFHFLAFLG
jgi:hypothetical protein